MQNRARIWIVVIMALVVGAAPWAGLTGGEKKPLTYAACDGWKSIQGAQIARDGGWVVYSLVPQDGDSELIVRNLKTDQEYRSARGKDPVLTMDGKFVVFTIAPLKADVDKAKKEMKKAEDQPKNGLGMMNLAKGEVIAVERVKSFKVAEESATHVAYLLEPPLKKDDKAEEGKKEEAKKEPAAKETEKKGVEKKEPEKKDEAKKPKEKKKEPGTDLIIRDLATGKTAILPEVVEYAWAKNGSWLAYAVSSKKPEDDGAFVRKAADGKTASLLKGLGHYKTLVFDEKSGQLAFLSDRDEYKNDAPAFKLYIWAEGQLAAAELVPALKGLAPGMSVSEHGRLQFSKDGGRLFFGYAPTPKAEPEDAPEPFKVDIWSWKDPDIQPAQKVNADETKKMNFTAVIHLREKKLVPLGGPDLPGVILSEDARLALGTSDLPYKQLVSWDQNYSDYNMVNLADGSRKKILEKFPGSLTISPGGQYLLYYDEIDNNWFSYRVLDGKTFNLTSKLGLRFEREDWDTPSEPSPYGIAGWTDGDRSILIYDRYDIWEMKPDGTGGRNATHGLGRREKTIFRYRPLDRDEKSIPVKTPILLAAVNDQTKASGYYRMTLASDAEPAKVVLLDRLVDGLQKARNAETYIFTVQNFDEFPDLWVSGPALAEMKRLSNANPQQADYLWGASDLIHYTNGDGKTLDAVLIKPENFDPSKKYPLLVYIYEKLADGLHRYQAPAPGRNINFSRYVSNGYVILQPDIVYQIGYPGSSALKCVLPAVGKVLEMGFIDPRRIGIQGHSWGGYEITYLITQTDLFAAVEAGAAVSNMTSAYGGIRYGTGSVREFQYEKSQSRIGAPLFARALQYIENSPLFWAERIKTPYLSIHNDEDDAVPWTQGIEFFTALRRLGKEAYMFNFNGEKHHLRDRENMKYWTVHLDEFFDHFLLGRPRPAWMDKPVPYLERGKRDIHSLFTPPAPAKEEKK